MSQKQGMLVLKSAFLCSAFDFVAFLKEHDCTVKTLLHPADTTGKKNVAFQ